MNTTVKTLSHQIQETQFDIIRNVDNNGATDKCIKNACELLEFITRYRHHLNDAKDIHDMVANIDSRIGYIKNGLRNLTPIISFNIQLLFQLRDAYLEWDKQHKEQMKQNPQQDEEEDYSSDEDKFLTYEELKNYVSDDGCKIYRLFIIVLDNWRKIEKGKLVDYMKRFKELGVDFENIYDDYNARTAIGYAIQKMRDESVNNLPLIESLIKAGANPMGDEVYEDCSLEGEYGFINFSSRYLDDTLAIDVIDLLVKYGYRINKYNIGFAGPDYCGNDDLEYHLRDIYNTQNRIVENSDDE